MTSFLINPYRFAAAAATDPNFANVSLLLHGDATPLVDSSGTPKTITAFGNAAYSTVQKKFGPGSIAFDGNGDYLSTGSSADFNFGTGDFTVEGWFYLPTASPGFGELFRINATDALYVNFRNSTTIALTSATIVYAQSASGAPVNQWFHFAATRSGTTSRVFIDGVSGTPVTCSVSFGATSQTGTIIGGTALNGYIDDLRITKGVARYTANFTPPTAPFPDS